MLGAMPAYTPTDKPAVHGEGGLYDHIAEQVLRITSADIVLLVVGGGAKGSGFSVSADPRSAAGVDAAMGGDDLVAMLRDIANQIERARPQAKGVPTKAKA